MLTVANVAKGFSSHDLFSGVGFRLLPGKRLAIVGGNGVGKTTLLEIAAGVQEADAGTVSLDRGVTLGYLPQEVMVDPDAIVFEEVLSGAGEIVAMERRMKVLEHRVAEDPSDANVQALVDLQDRFRNAGGYEVEADAHRTLAGLGFAPDDADRRVGELSGGWAMRVALARLLMSGADVLLLDEPTNHLDIASIGWLEETIRERAGTLLLVSHDRDFIDAIATHVLEIRGGRADEYTGSFQDFVIEREARIAAQKAAVKKQQDQREHLESFVERFRYKASKARQAQAKIKQLEKMEKLEVHDAKDLKVRFNFPPSPRVGRSVVEFKDVSAGFGDQTVVDHVDLVVERGSTVAFVGPNGAGKSTVLKLVTGDMQPWSGEVVLGHNVEPTYFAQHQVDALDLDSTVLETARGAFGDRERANSARSYLGSFGFTGDAALRDVGALSGGERSRLALACVMAQPRSLLVLDEPTNHLDLASRDVLEDALTAYDGTVLLVTHDRHLIRAVADTIVEVLPGRIRVYEMGWEEYVETTGGLAAQVVATAAGAGMDRQSAARVAAQERAPNRGDVAAQREAAERLAKQQQAAEREVARANKARSRQANGGSGGDPLERLDKQERRRFEAQLRQRVAKETGKLGQRVQRIEQELMQAEAEVAELTRQMAQPDAYDDPGAAKDLVARHGAAKDRADELMAQWEASSTELEKVTARITDEMRKQLA